MHVIVNLDGKKSFTDDGALCSVLNHIIMYFGSEIHFQIQLPFPHPQMIFCYTSRHCLSSSDAQWQSRCSLGCFSTARLVNRVCNSHTAAFYIWEDTWLSICLGSVRHRERMPRRFQKAVKYLQENLVGKAGAPMLTIRWLPALGEQTTSLQQACAVHQKASLLGSRIAVRWLRILGMENARFGPWVLQIKFWKLKAT